MNVVLNFPDDLPLGLGGGEPVCLAPDGVERTTRLLHHRLVHVPTTPPPAPVQQGLVVPDCEALQDEALSKELFNCQT